MEEPTLEENEAGGKDTDENLPIASFHEAHVFALASQSNIYSFCKLPKESGGWRLLIGCISRPFYSLEMKPTESFATDGSVEPHSEELLFTYIPAVADVISMDAFRRRKHQDDYVVGIAISKPTNEMGSPGQYLNIYSDWDCPGDLNRLTQSCYSIELDFLPYQLTHCEVPIRNPKVVATEIVLILGGSDERFHMFVENHQTSYVEIEIGEFFPELAISFSSRPRWTDFLYLDASFSRRLTAVACEDGHLILSLVDAKACPKAKVLHTWRTVVDPHGFAACVKLFFQTARSARVPRELRAHLPAEHQQFEESEFDADIDYDQLPPVNLVAVCTLSPSKVFHNVYHNGLSNCKILAGSDDSDVATTCVAADINMNGETDVVLGTFGQELLAYRYCQEMQEWNLMWTRSLNDPILGVDYIDVTGDGLKDLVVMTNRNVQILQHDLSVVRTLKIRRLKELFTKVT